MWLIDYLRGDKITAEDGTLRSGNTTVALDAIICPLGAVTFDRQLINGVPLQGDTVVITKYCGLAQIECGTLKHIGAELAAPEQPQVQTEFEESAVLYGDIINTVLPFVASNPVEPAYSRAPLRYIRLNDDVLEATNGNAMIRLNLPNKTGVRCFIEPVEYPVGGRVTIRHSGRYIENLFDNVAIRFKYLGEPWPGSPWPTTPPDNIVTTLPASIVIDPAEEEKVLKVMRGKKYIIELRKPVKDNRAPIVLSAPGVSILVMSIYTGA